MLCCFSWLRKGCVCDGGDGASVLDLYRIVGRERREGVFGRGIVREMYNKVVNWSLWGLECQGMLEMRYPGTATYLQLNTNRHP